MDPGDPSINKQKKLGKPLISSVLWLLDNLLSDVNIPTVCYKQKIGEKTYFLLASCKPLKKRAWSGSAIQRYGSADPDPYQNVTRLEHSFAISRGRQLPTSEQSLLKLPVRPIIPSFHHSTYKLWSPPPSPAVKLGKTQSHHSRIFLCGSTHQIARLRPYSR